MYRLREGGRSGRGRRGGERGEKNMEGTKKVFVVIKSLRFFNSMRHVSAARRGHPGARAGKRGTSCWREPEGRAGGTEHAGRSRRVEGTVEERE